jgi:hypothetical protein
VGSELREDEEVRDPTLAAPCLPRSNRANDAIVNTHVVTSDNSLTSNLPDALRDGRVSERAWKPGAYLVADASHDIPR